LRRSPDHLFHLFLQKIFRRDDSIRLATFNVEKDPGIIPAFTPRRGFVPVHRQFLKRRDLARVFLQHQQTLSNQPFIDAKPSIQALSAVVGNDEHGGFLIHQRQQTANFLIEIAIVVANCLQVRIPWHKVAMLGIVTVPEAMLNAIEPNLYKLKIVPARLCQVVTNHLEMLPAHGARYPG